MKQSICGCYRNAAGTQPFIFSIWVEQKGELSNYNTKELHAVTAFTVNRTIEVSSECASEVVLT